MWLNALEDILVPIAICVVLPVLVVWIINRRRMNADNLRARVLSEAIQHNADLDADKLAEAMRKPQKSPEQIRQFRLTIGLITTFMAITMVAFAIYINPMADKDNSLFILCAAILAPVGLGNLISYYMTRPK